MSKPAEIFKTTVPGVGPWCVEFPDGEIIFGTRDEARARLIAVGPALLEALVELLAAELIPMPSNEAGREAQDAWADRRAAARNNARAAIARATP